MPHADDASCGTAWRPCENDKPGVEPADGDEAGFAVVLAVVGAGEMQTGKRFVGAQKIQAARLLRPQTFCRVACDPHE